MSIGDLLHYELLGNRVMDYGLCLLVLAFSLILIWLLKRLVLARLKEWAARTANEFDDFLFSTLESKVLPLLYIGAFYLALRIMVLSPIFDRGLNILGLAALITTGVRFLLALMTFGIERYWIRKVDEKTQRHVLRAMLTVVKVGAWGLALVILLDNLGIQLSALVAGLGIGGVAVALAAQTILGDLFNYFTIFFDRPFEIGDFIIIGDYMGTVEHIGIKSTRLRSLGGEQLIFSNTDLTSSRVRNYKRMQRRRVVFKIGVIYETPLERIKEIPGIIAEIIKDMSDATLDRSHFSAFGSFSLDFETVYYVESSDYNRFMDIQQEINLRLMNKFAERGIEFAYPTQSIHLQPYGEIPNAGAREA